jgi:hypothetical protein
MISNCKKRKFTQVDFISNSNLCEPCFSHKHSKFISNKFISQTDLTDDVKKSNEKLIKLNNELNGLITIKNLEIDFLKKQSDKITSSLQEKIRLIEYLENKIIDMQIENYNKKLVIKD